MTDPLHTLSEPSCSMALPSSLLLSSSSSASASVPTRHGIHRNKHLIRAAFRSVSLVALIAGYAVYNYVELDTDRSNYGNIRTQNVRRSNNENNLHTQTTTSYKTEYPPASTTTASSNSHIQNKADGALLNGELDTNTLTSSSDGGLHGRTDDGRIRSASTHPYDRDVLENHSDYSDIISAHNPTTGRHLEVTLSSHHHDIFTGRKLTNEANLPSCDSIDKADPEWMLAFFIIGILYMFLALAVVCDEFFVPALEEMSSERHLHLSMDVAGATLMAAGGSAPELFTSLFGTFQDSEVGFGTIVGSAVFNVLFVIGMCSLLSKEILSLTWWPLFRDSLYYAIGLGMLAVFVGVTSPEEIQLWEAIVLFVMYLGYVVVMAFNRKMYKKITGKELSELGVVEAEEVEPEIERAPGALQRSSPSARSVLSVLAETGTPISFRWPGTFRAGVLKLLRDPDSWLETAGVGIVSKIAGDVDHVFRDVDLNGDGEIDKEELKSLFEKLDCHVAPEELDSVFKELDENGDGKISEQEFTAWYIRSEERILSKVRTTFDLFDVDHSGTIDRSEVKLLLEKLEPRVTDADVDDAIEAMYQHGSRDEITFEEFSDWYVHSLIYDRQKKRVEEEMEGAWESVKPPYGEGCMAYFKYVLVLPIVLVLTFTIPDVRRPGLHKWCYFSFFVSIAWIGFFSYLMVDWAEIVGNTIGIPSVVMGLTFLAAGTSVPDMLSSVIVARRGEGDMAVSSSIGSNIFDILVGLPVPWIIYTAWPTKPDTFKIGADSVWYSLFILLGMLVFIISAIHCQGWKLTKALGLLMFLFYFVFLAVSIVLERPFVTCRE